MIKDTLFKTLSIPILGVLIPLLSNLIRYPVLGWMEIIASNMHFIATSYIIWQGSVYIISKVRRLALVKQKFFLKLTMLCLATAVYAFIISSSSALIWQQIFLSIVDTKPVFDCGLISAVIVIFLTLMYEALFLSKERELDTKIVDQLDRERQHAELNSIKGELDPHFVFNALTTLSHLISVDHEKAQLFTQKLAQVYKYFLINKNKELISLADELEFIESYFYLLQIRHDNKLQLEAQFDEKSARVMIPPCSLQILVENAIKHNEFSDSTPLRIKVTINDQYLEVSNNIKPKLYAVNSTGIGLKNLSSRYKIICREDITIATTRENFIVKLPLIT